MAKRATATKATTVRAFDAGQSKRRLKSLPTATSAINTQIRRYGRTVLARSRYLATNNPYASAAKEVFVSALVGTGIKPYPMVADAELKSALSEAWLDWTDESDADMLTDLYGQQAMIAAEMFEAGECFVRLRPRRQEDGLLVPLQLQILPAEMLPLDNNRALSNGRRIECGIEFDAIGRRTTYHFLKQHPGSDQFFANYAGETTPVPAAEVLHLYRPIKAGQIRGIPHTVSAITKLAILDQYDDAELERKRMAALFAAFVTKPTMDQDPLGGETQQADGQKSGQPDNTVGLEPGATVDLEPGEDVRFSEPADVGGTYDVFQYRTLLSIAAGMGVTYAGMTGDLRQANYSSLRAGLIEFRRRIEAIQHAVMVFQFCRPVWQRWLSEAVLAQAVPIAPAAFQKNRRQIQRVKWIAPRWEWVDPLKDLQAEKLAVRAGFKSRSDVIDALGEDPESTDARISADKVRADAASLVFDSDASQVSGSGVVQTQLPETVSTQGGDAGGQNG